jgi:hypothetical protein
MVLEAVAPNDWYQPDITSPKFGLDPVDLAFERSMYRAMMGHSQKVDWPLRATASNALEDSPWLHAYGRPMFTSTAREIIDEAAWEGEVRWSPIVIATPAGVIDEYQLAAPALVHPDVLSESHTTRDPIGRPIRWVLDREKLGDRQVLMFPGVSVGGLVMRGRLLQQLLDLGARGVVIQPARVAPGA